MSERREQILKTAISIIEDEGYASLGMRSLARAVGIKHGAMRYHFRTWDELLRALVDYIDQLIQADFDARIQEGQLATPRDFAKFMLQNNSGDELLSDKLWPQLWAMQEVEPLVSDLLEDIYERYLRVLEQMLTDRGSQSPHVEALLLAAVLEGEGLFTGKGRRWEGDKALVHEEILRYISERYGNT